MRRIFNPERKPLWPAFLNLSVAFAVLALSWLVVGACFAALWRFVVRPILGA